MQIPMPIPVRLSVAGLSPARRFRSAPAGARHSPPARPAWPAHPPAAPGWLPGHGARHRPGWSGSPARLRSPAQARNTWHTVLRHKLEDFARLSAGSLYRQVFNQLGVLMFADDKRAPSRLSQVRALSKSFSAKVLGAMDRPCPQAQTRYSGELVDMVAALKRVLHERPPDINQDLDRLLLAHFLPWAPSEYSRLSQARPGQLSFDPRLQALLRSIAKLIDIRRPQDLHPGARRFKRQIHLHVGPTNSGKTHAALRALHGAHAGVYAGPLRLLAHEVFTRMNMGRIAPDLGPRPCNLLTGEEQRTVGLSAGLTSCTVEMLSSHQFYDVVVIDEIQMIGDVYRGDAWTQAVLGVQAKELHLCGEESVVELIRGISEMCGDQFILHRYQRLTPLRVGDHSLRGDLSKVRKGDCLVTFSRNSIYALKKEIQHATQLRVGMAYGGLPPEVREKEAEMFNRGSEVGGEAGYDVLVGSDAIGMGLNLKIKRIIFEALHKFDGRSQIPLSTSQIKQIGGRAGRFGVLPCAPQSTALGDVTTLPTVSPSVEPSVGEVLTLEESDMERLRECMVAPFEPVTKAVIKAPFSTIEGLARLVPEGARFSHLLALRRTLTITSPQFSIGDEKNAAQIADAVEEIHELCLSERDLFCSAPANPRNLASMAALRSWAKAHADRTEVDLLAWIRHENLETSIETIKSSFVETEAKSAERESIIDRLELSSANVGRKQERIHHEALLRLESLHKCLVLYLWLGFRLPESFPSIQLCQEWKQRCEEALALGLNFDGVNCGPHPTQTE